MAGIQTETDLDAAKSVDIRSLIGGITGFQLIYWWVSVRTVGVGAGLSIEGTSTDTNGATFLLSSSGETLSMDGSSLSCKTGLWVLFVDDTSPITLDIGYFSPFSEMRFDYAVFPIQV